MYAATTTNIPRALVLPPQPRLFSPPHLASNWTHTPLPPTHKGAVHLLSRILNTDPDKRSTVHEIRLHAWCVAEHPFPASFRPTATAPNPAVPTRRSDLDDKLLARALDLAKGGNNFNSAGAEPPRSSSSSSSALEAAAEGVLSGRHDPVGTTYHLLLKRKLRDGSAADSTNTSVNSAQHFAIQLEEPGPAKQGSSPSNNFVVAATPRPGGDGVYPKPKVNVPEGKVRVAARANSGALRVRANASNESSTKSSSRSGHRPAARRRKLDATAAARAAEVAFLKSTAAAAMREGPPISERVANGVQSNPREMLPQSASTSRPTYPHTASTASSVPMRPRAKGTRQGEADTGTRMMLTAAGRATNSLRSQTQRPVPLLSFRGIAQRDVNGGAVGGPGIVSGSSNGRLANSSVFVSQTARTGRCIVDNKSNPSVPAGHPTGGQARPRGGSGSSTNSGGSVGFHLIAATESPRRPSTARAPLRSSAPTPRLSGDFCLNRPRGGAIVAGCNRIVGGTTSSLATREVSGSGRPIANAPLASEPTRVASPTTAVTRPAAEHETSGRAEAAGSTLPRPMVTTKQQQPSLRVRLSTVPAKAPQQSRQPVLEAERRVGVKARIGAPATVPDRRDNIESKLIPHRPSSCDDAAAIEAALASPVRSVAAGGRVFGRGHPVRWNVSSRGKARKAPSAKGWARGTPVAFRPVDSTCAGGLPLADTARAGGR